MLNGYKTYVSAGTLIVYTLLRAHYHDISVVDATITVLGAMSAIGLRSAIKEVERVIADLLPTVNAVVARPVPPVTTAGTVSAPEVPPVA